MDSNRTGTVAAVSPVAVAATHHLYWWLRRVTGDTRHPSSGDEHTASRDRGAVSLEQVLWFVASGVAVAVVAKILWDRIFDSVSNAPIDAPASPTGS